MATRTHSTIPPGVLQRHHLYADVDDELKHFGEIQLIASELKRPLEEIARMYESVLEDLGSHAHVMDYLPILVSKNVRALSKKTRSMR